MSRELRITGEGRLSLKPDIAKIKLPVVSKELEYRAAIEELNKKVFAVHDILENNGINKDCLRTTDFLIRENWKYFKDERLKPKFEGYTASHDLILELPLDNSLMSSVLSDLTNRGLGISFSISFDVSDREKHNKELIRNAVLDAKESAEVIAEASGISLKEIINIDYSFSEIKFHNEENEYDIMTKCCCDMSIPDFAPDDIKAKKNITIIWLIE